MAVSHVAFSDESRYITGRHRSIAIVSCPIDRVEAVRAPIAALMTAGRVREIKWQALKSAKEKFVAIDLINYLMPLINRGHARIDVLIWDVEDQRHDIQNRDDVANFEIMYYQIFRNVMRLRWPPDSEWALYPDENSLVNWGRLAEILRFKSSVTEIKPKTLFSQGGLALALRREFGIDSITPVGSHDEPLCQVADLFAGLAAYSYVAFDHFTQWRVTASEQTSFDFDNQVPFKCTSSEVHRFPTLEHLHRACKSCHAPISLTSTRGLKTHQPSFHLNFWPYVVQHDDDKAPTKR